MKRSTALLLVLVLWAGIYLPGLGSTEIKGEEGRRILPAITMLDTGNWLVPYVGGKPFLRKPPLVNWAIAGSFKVFGERTELAARLPAALCVLALGLVIVATSGGAWISIETGLIAAIVAMTQSGLLAKAKFAGAEIEGIYAPISGIAIVCWLAWWVQGRSRWLLWSVPGVLLGLACLAKGPSLHLVFFYVIVIAVLWKAKALRELLHPAHFLGLAIAAGIFAAWAVPYFKTPEAKGAAAVWKRQGIDRFTDSEFVAGNYFSNIPRGLVDGLPWVIFAGVLVGAVRRENRAHGPHEPHVLADAAPWNEERCSRKVLAIAVAGCFFGVLLVPGTLPRYVLPLGAPLAVLLASAMAGAGEKTMLIWRWTLRVLALVVALGGAAGCLYLAFLQKSWNEHSQVFYRQWGTWTTQVPPGTFDFIAAGLLGMIAIYIFWHVVKMRTPLQLTIEGACLLVIVMLLFTHTIVRGLWTREYDRPFAASIDNLLRGKERLVIFDPGYLPAIFYLRSPYEYVLNVEDMPTDAKWVLMRGERKKFTVRYPDFAVFTKIPTREKEFFLLLHREGERKK